MLTQLETAAANNLLKNLTSSNIGEDCRNLAQAYAVINTVAWERHCRTTIKGCSPQDVPETQPPADATPEAPSAEPPAPTTGRATRTRKTPPAAETPAAPADAPAIDLGIGGTTETPAPAATPEPAASAAPAATGWAAKTYVEKQAELKAAFVNKLRIVNEANAKEGASLQDKVAAEMKRLGFAKLSDPGEANIDAFYSFIINVVPDKDAAAPLIEI